MNEINLICNLDLSGNIRILEVEEFNRVFISTWITSLQKIFLVYLFQLVD